MRKWLRRHCCYQERISWKERFHSWLIEMEYVKSLSSREHVQFTKILQKNKQEEMSPGLHCCHTSQLWTWLPFGWMDRWSRWNWTGHLPPCVASVTESLSHASVVTWKKPLEGRSKQWWSPVYVPSLFHLEGGPRKSLGGVHIRSKGCEEEKQVDCVEKA